MNISESIRMSLRSLAANKMRAGLTMLGIVIGTGAVIALLAVGQGARVEITNQIQSIGSNLIFVFPGQLNQGGFRPTSPRAIRPLTLQDALAIADPVRCPHVAAVAPQVQRSASVTARGQSLTQSILGTTPAFETVRSSPAQYGSFLSQADETGASRVAVLGAKTAVDFFEDAEAALGQTLRVNRVPFKVIGVLEEKGGQGFGGGDADRVIIVPLSALYRSLFSDRAASGQQQVSFINASAVDEANTDQAIAEITEVMRERHDIQYGEDDFTVTSQKDILSVFSQITNLLTVFLGAIAGISLLVGGIGIMNIMLVSVTERTREIGIRKAVGAKRSDILWQFLVESVVLSLVGGVVGIGLGWGLATFVRVVANFTTVVTLQAVALSVGFSLAVGLFFGIYPASRASNLNPIDALRYE